jgi:exonuclease SbcC
MKLRKLSIERFAGIDRPFELDGLASGFNLLVGPNGIGKSRICAAVRALLWDAHARSGDALTARAGFVHGEVDWHVRRDGSLHEWQRDGVVSAAPALPGERLDGCFFLGLRDLLDDSDAADRDLAHEIRRQMAGGFDLDSTRHHFEGAIPARSGQKEKVALGNAEKEIREADYAQADVERRARELESLKSRAAAGDRALHRLEHFKTAILLQGLRSEYGQHQRELSAMPNALANLDGKEIERLDQIETALVEKQAEREATGQALVESKALAREARLDAPIEGTALATWRERTERLAEVERNLESAIVDVRGAADALEASQRALGGLRVVDEDSDLAGLPPIEGDFDLFAFLDKSQKLTIEKEALNERLRLLAAREFSEDEARRLELMKRAIRPLREWLRAPDPIAVAGRGTLWPARAWTLISGVVIATIGLATQWAMPVPPFDLVLVGMGIALVASGLISRVRVDGADETDWRGVSQAQFPDAIEGPAEWSRELVEERLSQLEDELAKLEGKEKRSEIRLVERAQLQEKLNGLAEPSKAIEDHRESLNRRLGLDALRPDSEMVDLARALDAARKAAVDWRRATAKAEALGDQRDRSLGSLADALREWDGGEPTDAASARAFVQSLEERDRQLRAAARDTSREEQSRDRIDRELARLGVAKTALFSASGVEQMDRGELARRVGLLGRYAELSAYCTEHASRIARAESELEVAGETALSTRDLAALREEQSALLEISGETDGLKQQIWEIERDARDAREGCRLEDAIAQKDAALRALRDRRDEALAARAGSFLVDSIRQEHETEQMPRVLERARERFSSFTHHRYELRVASDDGGSFVAFDVKRDEGLRPDQLSDGTRAQLILAVRLAFAEEAEHGADLPIFLDEAMDHSDPERFHAIACALARMVQTDGRQFFYLSNDPTDVQRFEAAFEEVGGDPPNTINLGEVRGQQARVDGPGALRVRPLAEPPSPDGLEAAEYGVVIGVPALDPSDDPMALHLYYVLNNGLEALHQLLLAKIETLGQWRSLQKGGSEFFKAFTSANTAGRELEARIALLETFCLAWREGRGKPVGRAALEASEALSERYLPAFVEVADALHGDARLLLATVAERKEPRFKGYRNDSAKKLEEYLSSSGYLDARPILDESEIIERAVGTPAANLLSPRRTAELVHEWWRLCRADGSDPADTESIPNA